MNLKNGGLKKMTEDYAYSVNSENYFLFDSLAEAVEELMGDAGQKGVYEIFRAKPKRYKTTDLIPSFPSEYLIEAMCDNAYDEAGEFTEAWCNKVSTNKSWKELDRRLSRLIMDHFKANKLEPDFFTVEIPEVIKIKITECIPEFKWYEL